MKSRRNRRNRRNTYKQRRSRRTSKRLNRLSRRKQRGGAMRPRDPIPFSAVVEHRPLEDEMTGVARFAPYETFQQMKENDELT